MVKIAPSILAADLSRLGEEVRRVEEAGADLLHVDVMDGHFVPNLTFGPVLLEKLQGCTALPLDVHLMVENPERYLADFRRAGAAILTVHAEACTHLDRVVHQIKELGARAGVALNPHTPLDFLDYVLPDIDMVLVMSVNPGFGGQKFIPAAVDKIRRLAAAVRERGLALDIEVDGGIGPATATAVVAAGATVLVAGSAVYGQPDVAQAIAALRRAAENP
ncbi:MAG: ribulose-phosphate 3-epimerase [Symbiobacteriia bacterium]